MSAPGPRPEVGGEGKCPLTADAVAALLDATIVGDPSCGIRAAAPLDRAQPDEIAFLAAARYLPLFASTHAGVVLVPPELADSPGPARCRIIVPDPHAAMLRLLPLLYPPVEAASGIHATAVIGRRVTLGREVSIGPYAVLEDGAVIGQRVRVDSHCSIGRDVEVGDDSRLFHGVTLYSGARVGRRVRLHAGSRIACDGFGYTSRDGAHQKVPHVGLCIIEDDVEIGANTTIDRGSIDHTVVGAGTKVDNLVHIAHNVRIGRLCLIMAQVGIAGSCHIGDGVILAGQVGVSDHRTIGAGARLAAQAGVFGNVPTGETWSGYPARPHKAALRASAALFRLAGMLKHLERLVERERS